VIVFSAKKYFLCIAALAVEEFGFERFHALIHNSYKGVWKQKTTVQLSKTFSCLLSQSLINLLLTGFAVSNVWDGDRECSGMSEYEFDLPYSNVE
ncbi:putative Protein FAM188A-like protein, partial [Naja naja]